MRTYSIVPISYLSVVDFATIDQTSLETCRQSLNGGEAVISWTGNPPDDIEWPTFTLDEILVQMQRSEWTDTETID